MEPLQGMFATTILKLDELPPDPKDERIYDLGLLGKRGFDFVYGIGSGIEDVAVSTQLFSNLGIIAGRSNRRLNQPQLARMWDKRQRGYRAMGYEIKPTETVILRNCSNLK